MSIICIAKETATIGKTTWGADGKIISQTPARWEHDPAGSNRKMEFEDTPLMEGETQYVSLCK